MPKPTNEIEPSGTLREPHDTSTLPGGPGSYVLVLRLPAPARLAVGKLGEFLFQPGWYLYCGTALGGLRGRVARHLKQEHRVHWHIGYLNSGSTGVGVEAVWWAEGRSRQECQWADALAGLPGASRPVAGFGASDCGCGSHLIYSPTPPSPGDGNWQS